MLSFLPGPIRGACAFGLIVLNTLLGSLFFFPVVFAKLIVPIKAWRDLMSRALIFISTNWIACNGLAMDLFNKVEYQVTGVEKLEMDDWYFVTSNHQSWADILVLQRIFNRKIPFLKFFLKKELIWVPVMGVVWWALDFPFMKRYSKDYLEKRPEMKGKDLETTKAACEKFRTIPVSVMNFLEGTRFNQAMHDQQKSPYQHLLKPKAAGIAFVLGAMGEQINYIVDVTIVYPDGAKTFFQFLSGQNHKVVIEVETIPVTDEILGDYSEDPEFRARFQTWINEMWKRKDERMKAMLD